MADFTKSKFLKEWKEQNRMILKTMHPNLDDNKINTYLDEVIEKNIKVRNGVLANNYNHRKIAVDTLRLYDWYKRVKPIAAGYGCFFMNQNQADNPSAKMQDKFLILRKKYKAKMYTFKESSYEYSSWDGRQAGEKVNVNSYYGASGAPSSRFFNLYTASATTLTAQSLISTTELAFEAFLGNNFKFIDIDECLFYMTNIINEKHRIDAGLLNDIEEDILYERLKIQFYEFKDSYEPILKKFICSLSQESINRIYYKNNIFEFSYLYEIRSLLSHILKHTEEFKNPSEIPVNVKDAFDDLWEYYREFVFYNNSYIDRIKRLKKDRRNVVSVIDTDSNIVNINPWYEFITSTIVNNNNELGVRDKDNLKFIIINTMAFLLTKMINQVLAKYTKMSNVLKEFRVRIGMKNEFLFLRVLIANAKKTYLSSMKLREGKEFNPPKLDVKGFQFMKSVTREETGDFFKKVCHERILKSDKIDIPQIIRDVEYLEDYIKESLLKGEKNFLIPKSVKEVEAYDDPFREQGMRAVIAWNAIYENSNPIQLPEKVDIIKVHMETLESISDLMETEPEIYNNIKTKIFESGVEKLAKKGIEVIAVPRTQPTIPEWIMPYIDYDTIINDNISKFNAVLESLGIEIVGNAKGKYFTNLIRI